MDRSAKKFEMQKAIAELELRHCEFKASADRLIEEGMHVRTTSEVLKENIKHLKRLTPECQWNMIETEVNTNIVLDAASRADK